jgi:hypothetical protein
MGAGLHGGIKGTYGSRERERITSIPNAKLLIFR